MKCLVVQPHFVTALKKSVVQTYYFFDYKSSFRIAELSSSLKY